MSPKNGLFIYSYQVIRSFIFSYYIKPLSAVYCYLVLLSDTAIRHLYGHQNRIDGHLYGHLNPSPRDEEWG